MSRLFLICICVMRTLIARSKTTTRTRKVTTTRHSRDVTTKLTSETYKMEDALPIHDAAVPRVEYTIATPRIDCTASNHRICKSSGGEPNSSWEHVPIYVERVRPDAVAPKARIRQRRVPIQQSSSHLAVPGKRRSKCRRVSSVLRLQTGVYAGFFSYF